MSNAELQVEEREVLLSIYEGDQAFNQLTPITYQYKFGEDNDCQSFLLEISWGQNYPMEKPVINMNTFYNRHIVQNVKDKIIAHVEAEAVQSLGSAMTYTLFQSVKENLTQLIADQPSNITNIEDRNQKIEITSPHTNDELMKKTKKEQLTKAQKRRQWNHIDNKDDKPRGWNWIDIVKHLSQTGSIPEQVS